MSIKHNKIFFHLSLFLLILPQILTATATRQIGVLVLLWVFLLFLSNISKIVFMLFSFYVTIINIFQIHIFLHWGDSGSLSDRVGVAMQSPVYEIVEYFDSFVSLFDVFFILYSFAMFFVLVWLLVKNKTKIQKYKKTYIILCVVLLLGLQNQEPLKIIKYYIKTSKLNNTIAERKTFLKNFTQSKNKEYHIDIYDKIIIIQGEAANKHHLEIYGYQKPTTPFFSKLDGEMQSNTFYKYQAFAPTNQTRYSVPMFFTPANVNNFYYNYSSNVSIITDFKHKTYKTYWISNQGKIGQHDDSIVSIASEAHEALFLNDGSTDMVLVDYLKQIKPNNDKEFFVFHLIGSHVKYKARYKNHNILINDSKNIVDEYDNTIYMTDNIIEKIFDHFTKQQKKIILIYISDHGEVVNKKKHGHGFLPSYQDEYDIPFVIYSSIENERLKILSQQNNKKFNLESLNYIIKYVTGISDENNISFGSDIFSLSPKNKLNYKKLKKYK